METGIGLSDSTADNCEVGRLPMSDEELGVLERNRRLARRVMVPIMVVLGACGFMGGIWAMGTDTLAIGIGLTFSALIMLGLAWAYYTSARKPIARPEKFFVSGIVTEKKKTGSVVTWVYYRIELNNKRYGCYLSEAEFNRVKVGDRVRCERLVESSVDADRVVIL